MDLPQQEEIAGAGWIDGYRRMAIDLGNAVCVVTPITAKKYCNLFPQSLPICEDYSYFQSCEA